MLRSGVTEFNKSKDNKMKAFVTKCDFCEKVIEDDEGIHLNGDISSLSGIKLITTDEADVCLVCFIKNMSEGFRKELKNYLCGIR